MRAPCADKDREGHAQFEDNALAHRAIWHRRAVEQRDFAQEDLRRIRAMHDEATPPQHRLLRVSTCSAHEVHAGSEVFSLLNYPTDTLRASSVTSLAPEWANCIMPARRRRVAPPCRNNNNLVILQEAPRSLLPFPLTTEPPCSYRTSGNRRNSAYLKHRDTDPLPCP